MGAGFAPAGSLLPTWAAGGERYGDGVTLSGDDVVVFSNCEGPQAELEDADRLVLYSFRGTGCPSLTGVPAEIPAEPGATQKLFLDVGAAHAGEAYVVLGSLAGTQPGFNVQGFTIPLNPDAYLLATLTQPNLPPFVGSFGTLDAAGRATATFVVPPSPDLSNTLGDHAAVGLDLAARCITFVTRPQPLALR